MLINPQFGHSREKRQARTRRSLTRNGGLNRGHAKPGDEGIKDHRDDGHQSRSFIQIEAQEQERETPEDETGRSKKEGRHQGNVYPGNG